MAPVLTVPADAATRIRQSDKESAAIIGFTSAIAAYGAFFIPKSYGTSISMFGGPEQALYAFIVFYLTCVALTGLILIDRIFFYPPILFVFGLVGFLRGICTGNLNGE